MSSVFNKEFLFCFCTHYHLRTWEITSHTHCSSFKYISFCYLLFYLWFSHFVWHALAAFFLTVMLGTQRDCQIGMSGYEVLLCFLTLFLQCFVFFLIIFHSTPDSIGGGGSVITPVPLKDVYYHLISKSSSCYLNCLHFMIMAMSSCRAYMVSVSSPNTLLDVRHSLFTLGSLWILRCFFPAFGRISYFLQTSDFQFTVAI